MRPDSSPNTYYGGAPLTVGPVGDREALALVDVWACVNLLSSVASTLPLIAYRKAEHGRVRIVGGHVVELLRSPAPGTTLANLIGQLVASLALRGNAFLGLFQNADGVLSQLGVIDPARVTVQIVSGEPQYLLTHLDGRQTRHDGSDLVHIKLPLSLDGVVALSPVAQCRAALGLNLALTTEAVALMQNATAPRGVLSITSGPASEDLLQNLERDWSARHSGPEKAGRVAVLSSDVSFTALSLSPHDAEFVEQRKLSTQEIFRIWSIPPWMLNGPSNDAMTYSNTESQAAAFAKFTLSPYLCAIEQSLTNSRLCVGRETYLEFLLDALLRPDTLSRYQGYEIALGNAQSPGFMTREEIRQRENLPPETTTTEAT